MSGLLGAGMVVQAGAHSGLPLASPAALSLFLNVVRVIHAVPAAHRWEFPHRLLCLPRFLVPHLTDE